VKKKQVVMKNRVADRSYRKAQSTVVELLNDGGRLPAKDRRYYVKYFGDKVIRNLRFENI
jgi:hypothetical protein